MGCVSGVTESAWGDEAGRGRDGVRAGPQRESMGSPEKREGISDRLQHGQRPCGEMSWLIREPLA